MTEANDTPTVVETEAVSRTAVLTADQLNAEEWAAYLAKLDSARRSAESNIRYAEQNLETYRKRLETYESETAPAFLRLLTAKRLLAAAGIDCHQGWCDNLIIRLGHLKAADAEAKLTELSRVLGAFNADDKSVDVADHDGKKVLAVEMPSKRWPVVVKYTTPSSKKFQCRIVKQVKHEVLCEAVDA